MDNFQPKDAKTKLILVVPEKSTGHLESYLGVLAVKRQAKGVNSLLWLLSQADWTVLFILHFLSFQPLNLPLFILLPLLSLPF